MTEPIDFYKDLNFYTLEEGILIRAILELTYQLQLQLRALLLRGFSHQRQELATEDWKRVIDELKLHEGVYSLTLTGVRGHGAQATSGRSSSTPASGASPCASSPTAAASPRRTPTATSTCSRPPSRSPSTARAPRPMSSVTGNQRWFDKHHRRHPLAARARSARRGQAADPAQQRWQTSPRSSSSARRWACTSRPRRRSPCATTATGRP